ncbi:MAG: hypothetical protein Q4F88_07055, partial [Eubacteriales bacterium]|nr:hypothetical protein [Eubacteriales bacterium]
FTERYYQYNGIKYSLTDIFNKFIVLWKYKGTKCSTAEVLEELDIVEYPNTNAEEAILKLCDFIINIRNFLLFEKSRLDDEADEAEQHNRYCLDGEEVKVPKRLFIHDKMINDLINEILNSLNYEILEKEDYQCFIVKKNVDSEETAKVIQDNDISAKVLQYNDYRIVYDKDAKKDLLKSLADYFEGHKKQIKSFNSDLENNISFALNNFNIRHNNTTGAKANEFVKSISDKELITLYDKTYFLMIIAFRLIALKDFEKDIDGIRKNKFKK